MAHKLIRYSELTERCINQIIANNRILTNENQKAFHDVEALGWNMEQGR